MQPAIYVRKRTEQRVNFIFEYLLTIGYNSSVYTLRYHKRAIKALAQMPLDVRLHLHAELEDVARSPFTYDGDFKQLQGREGWRLRYGKYRVICHISNAELLILVVDAGPRGDIYK